MFQFIKPTLKVDLIDWLLTFIVNKNNFKKKTESKT